MKRIHLCVLVVATAIALSPLALQSFAEDVRISIPAAVGFSVTNVGVATNGTSATTISFNSLSVTSGRVLRVSIKADGDFVPPGGTAIPASKVSWTTSSPTNGTGNSGTLSTSAYTQLFQSAATKKTGSVNIAWTLGAPGVPLRAGNHTLTVRWKLESIAP
jgi:hypothetical protein